MEFILDKLTKLAIVVRKARRRDAPQLLDLIRDLANYERLEPPSSQARRRLVHDIFDSRRLKAFVAYECEGKREGKALGYALYFYTYSSFLARPTLYLEDIFVKEGYRGKGVGKSLFIKCVKEALKNNCGRMEWAVLTWNKNAINFYEKKMKARRLDDWYYYRLERARLLELDRESSKKKEKSSESIEFT